METKPDHSNPKPIAILGSTGSIGTQALEVVEEFPDRFYPAVLTAHRNADLLISQALKFKPKQVVIGDDSLYTKVCDALGGTGIGVSSGKEALEEAMELDEIETVLTGLRGICRTWAHHKGDQKGKDHCTGK